MHELSIAYSLIEQVEAAAAQHGFQKVNQLHLLVGEWSGVDADALRFCFPQVSRGTCLMDSQLLITTQALKIQCLDCPHVCHIRFGSAVVCEKCGSGNCVEIEGKDLRIVDLDVD